MGATHLWREVERCYLNSQKDNYINNPVYYNYWFDNAYYLLKRLEELEEGATK